MSAAARPFAGDGDIVDANDGPPLQTGDGASGPADRRVIVGYGFWIFILSDIIMFAAFFAAFTVASRAFADGPTGAQLFEMNGVKLETALLLTSSLTCGLAAIAVEARRAGIMQFWLAATALLGAGFLALELREFATLFHEGAGPDRSAFWSAFFGLVGLHGAHVTFGLCWLAILMVQVAVKGFRPDMLRKLLCFSIFWHALDIVWVGVLTTVYLIGSLA